MTAPDIFLSYNREDLAVTRIYAAALTAEGFSVWSDQTLKSGDTYDEVTEGALRAAKAVVVLWTPRSVASRWVKAEATLGQRQNTLVPVMVEPCERPVMFELTQTADLIGWQGNADDPSWRSLIDDIRRFADKPAAEAAHAPAPTLPALALPKKPSVAVLPFANIGGGEDDNYFADGMAVEIVSALSRFQSLFVISSGSTLSYRGDSRGPAAIARELGVRYILQGNVRKAGKQVRIAIELLDEVTLSPIWTDRFDGSLDDVFGLQDEVASAVTARIDSSIQANELRKARARPTEDQRAYDLFLRASHKMWSTYGEPGLIEAVKLFDQAIERDPRFALAMAMCSVACFSLQERNLAANSADLRTKCLTLAQRAVQTDMDDYRVLAWASYSFLLCGKQIATARRLMEQALAMNPGDSVTHYLSGWVNLFSSDPATALANFESVLRLDPRSQWRLPTLGGRGIALLLLDRIEEAIPYLLEVAEHLHRYRSLFKTLLAAAYGFLGKADEARIAMSTNQRLKADDEVFIGFVTDGSLMKRISEGLRLAGIELETA